MAAGKRSSIIGTQHRKRGKTIGGAEALKRANERRRTENKTPEQEAEEIYQESVTDKNENGGAENGGSPTRI